MAAVDALQWLAVEACGTVTVGRCIFVPAVRLVLSEVLEYRRRDGFDRVDSGAHMHSTDDSAINAVSAELGQMAWFLALTADQSMKHTLLDHVSSLPNSHC